MSDELIEILRPEATEHEVGGNRPIRLDSSTTVWLVIAGEVEIFAVPPSKGEPESADRQRFSRTHLATAGPGRMLFGVIPGPRRTLMGRAPAEESPPARLLAIPHPGTRLLEVAAEALVRLAREPRHVPWLAAAVEDWVSGLFERVSRAAAPQHFAELQAGGEVEIGEEGGVARPAGRVVWVRHVAGETRFLGREELRVGPADFLVPISEETWLVSDESAVLSGVATGHLLRSGGLSEGLGHFHRLFLRYVTRQVAAVSEEERRRLDERLELDDATLRGAYTHLASVLGTEEAPPVSFRESGDTLVVACRLVGQHQGLELEAPPVAPDGDAASASPASRSLGARLRRICDASRVRSRQVLLRDDWWRRDNGPLLAFMEEQETAPDPEEKPRTIRRPVALLPTSPTSYELIDPERGSRSTVDGVLADRLAGEAHMFYPVLPERGVKPSSLLALAFAGRRRDLLTILAMGVGGGLLALLVPIVTGQLFGRVIPGADRSQLIQLTLGLVLAALGTAAFQITRSIAVLRLTGKIDGTVQAAVWDRLLSLPSAFFRRFTVGDLTARAMGIDAIRNLLLGNVTTSFLSLVFSIFSFGLLFYYSWKLALLASGLILLLALVATLFAWIQLRFQRQLLAIEGRIASMLFGLIHGISKLRIAGAERRAFALWAEHFTAARQTTFKAQRIANLQTAWNAFFGLATTLALFALMGRALESGLTVSRFLAFSAAFGQVQAAALSFIAVISGLLTMVPIYERLSPILEEVPEVDETKIEAGELAGEIEMSHVFFRYHADGPLILNDVTIRARPGEFVALVGPSGSGKSTTLRLLLGFETPDAGSIYFDGQDIASLDRQSVRRQIGVVLQNSRPMSGSIVDNILGASNLGIEAAWEAAQMAGLADDIKAMPMGMHTVISEGAGTFSGGQIQRLMIARAIVHRPRIIFFDEATSALDNRTQDIVSRSLEGLKATRIVVAHRLSTIENADRIYVLEGGRVVEEGKFGELVERGGVFARLADRQVA